MSERIDAHQHFWQVSRGDYGWMSPELTTLYRDFDPDDLQPLMRRAGIDRTVVVQAAETEAETDYLLDIAERTNWVAGVVGWLDMTREDFPDRLAAYRARRKWVGLRPMFQDHDPAMILNPTVLDNIGHVARANVPFDILTFPRHLPNMLTALQQAPGLRAVVDHISKPGIAEGALDPWSQDMARIAAFPDVMCKVSGIITEAGADWSMDQIRPYVARVVDLFGPERLIFGSDWPVCTLAGSYADVAALAQTLLSEHFGPEQMAMVFGGNAARFYGI